MNHILIVSSNHLNAMWTDDLKNIGTPYENVDQWVDMAKCIVANSWEMAEIKN